VLAVGWRAIVTGRAGKANHVVLTDNDGTTPLGTLAAGLEVEILAWRPHGTHDTRYRVLSRKGGIEGWLAAASLTPSRLPLPANKPAPGVMPGRSTPAGGRPPVVGAPRPGTPPVAARRAPVVVGAPRPGTPPVAARRAPVKVKSVRPVKHPARGATRRSR